MFSNGSEWITLADLGTELQWSLSEVCEFISMDWGQKLLLKIFTTFWCVISKKKRKKSCFLNLKKRTLIITYILSCTVSKLSHRIGQIIVFGSLVWAELLNSGLRSLASKTRNVTLLCAARLFRYIEPFRCEAPVWQTDGRTNGQNCDSDFCDILSDLHIDG